MISARTLMRSRTCSRRSGGNEDETPLPSGPFAAGGKRVTFSCIYKEKMGLGRAQRKVTFVPMNPALSGSGRILIVMAAQWPRALLRAELREAGYDALGARDLDQALTYPKEEAGRGRVALIILDQAVLGGADDPRLKELLRRHGDAETLLIAGAF